NKSAKGRPNGHSILRTGDVKPRVECRQSPPCVIRRKVQFVAKPKFQRERLRDFPVVVGEKVVVPGALAAVVQPAAKRRNVCVSIQEILKRLKINLPACEILGRKIYTVIADLCAAGECVPPS